jgi:hypothetical protein
MDKDETQVEQSGCGCDSSSGDDTCCSPGGGKSNLRTALFVVVLVLAGGVAAHSVLTNGGKTSPCGTGGPICGMEQANDADVKAAGCPTGKTNGDCEKACLSEKKACQKTGAAGKAAGCSPSEAAADPAPQPAPTAPAGGCCPGH